MASGQGDRGAVLATQDICSQKRRMKGGVVVVKQALVERVVHRASTGTTAEQGTIPKGQGGWQQASLMC